MKWKTEKKREDQKKREVQFVRKMHKDLFIASSRWQIKPVNEQVFTLAYTYK